MSANFPPWSIAETPGTKLRRLAAAASFRDLVDRPLTLPPAYTSFSTTTNASFTMPAVNATVNVIALASSGAVAGNKLIINTAGQVIITAVVDAVTFTVRNTGISGNASPGATIASGVAVNTQYRTGDIVSNAGGWYLCAATINAAATAPTGVTGAFSTDSAGFWTYIGGPPVTAVDAQLPVVTFDATGFTGGGTVVTPPTGLSNFYGAPSSTFLKIIGANGVTTGTYYQTYRSYYTDIANTVASSTGTKVEFVTDAPKFAIGWANSAGGCIIYVDGRPIQAGRILTIAGSPNWIVVDFTAIQARKNRTISIQASTGFTGNLCGIAVPTDCQIRPTVNPDTVRVAVCSDSIWAGSTYSCFRHGHSLGTLLGKYTGWDDVWSFSMGGTGYIAQGTSSLYKTYGQRVAEMVATNPSIYVFQGSTNDLGQTTNAITAAALACYNAVRASSSAPIIVFGVWPMNTGASGISLIPSTETAYAAAVTAAGGAANGIYWIPINGGSPQPPITNTTNNTGGLSQNAATYVGGDLTHPVDLALPYFANWLADQIRVNVLPLIK